MKSNNLYLFPALPNKNSGYEWAVKSDITQLEINKSDYVIFFATDESIKNYKENNIINKNVFFIPRKKSLKRSLYCIFTFQHPSFFLNTDWKKLPEEVRNKRYNNVFFGASIFYPIYRLVSHNNAQFRFHNLWYRILKQSKVSVFNLKNYLNIRYLSVIERKILKLNASFYFITEKDKQFAFIDNSKFNFLPINSDLFEEKTVTIIDNVVGKAVIWFGSISTHKYASIKSFIKIFKELRKTHDDLNFILYGKGSEEFEDKENGVWGMGFYEDDFSLPITSNCIYINPDDTGGGIKIKNFDIIKTNEINYLSTPEGFEGCEIYSREGIKVLPFSKWYKYLNKYFS